MTSSASASQIQRVLRFRELGILVVVLGLGLGLVLARHAFLQPTNIKAIALSISSLAIVAAGETVVIITRNIDLSVGSTLGLGAMALALTAQAHPSLSVPILVAIALLVGLAAGLVNGVVVALGVPSIIVTLATLSIYRGLIFLISHSVQVNAQSIPQGLSTIASSSVLGLPWMFWIALGVLAVGGWLLAFSRTGRQLYALGSNPRAAVTRGLPVRRRTVFVFAISGGLAGIGGAMYAAQFGTVNPADVGLGFELSVITAVVIGGASILGGSGSMTGTALGCLLIGIVANGLTVIGVSQFWEQAVDGLILLGAVVFNSEVRRRVERGRVVRGIAP